ncbi:MAG: hypothetical protein IT178_17350 [Acidobacteria bacterium]|nr:hypothetical protein [Acidobacteriota bacterium]
MNISTLIQKLWNYGNVLRDDGMSYGDYVEQPDGRWCVCSYDELIARDKASLDIFGLKDESLADCENLPPPEVIAQEIVEDLEAELEQFRLIAGELQAGTAE